MTPGPGPWETATIVIDCLTFAHVCSQPRRLVRGAVSAAAALPAAGPVRRAVHRDALPEPRALQLGVHRDRVRARLPEDREGRTAAARRRVPRRHAVPDAGRRSAAGADR